MSHCTGHNIRIRISRTVIEGNYILKIRSTHRDLHKELTLSSKVFTINTRDWQEAETLTPPFFVSSLRRYKIDSYVKCQFKNHAFEKYAHISMMSVSNSICEAKLLKPGNAGQKKKDEKKIEPFRHCPESRIWGRPYPNHDILLTLVLFVIARWTWGSQLLDIWGLPFSVLVLPSLLGLRSWLYQRL